MSENQKQELRKFWVVLLAAILVIGTIVGVYSVETSKPGTIDTFYQAPRRARSSPGTQEEVTQEPRERAATVARSLAKVTKIIEEGVIQRIDEPHRKLFINEPVWNALTPGQQEQTVRVVAAHLDVASDNPTGIVTVYSFRNGKLVAAINEDGTYTFYR